MTLFWSSEATGDGRSVLLFILWSLHLRQAPNTKKVRMKKQGSVSNPKLPTWSPWPWFIHLDKNLVGTRHFLMFWGCINIRVVHGFFANVAEPLGYVKHRVDQSSPWFSGFLQQAFCREFLHEPAHRTLPEACSDWKHQWSLAEAKAKSTEDVLPFLELMTCHHRVKSSLMRETYQWKIHQPNKQQVSTEASWTQAYAGRGKILMTWFLVSGSSTSIWMMKILSYRTVVVYMCSEGQRSWKVPCRR